jgi:RNA polymerase sigma-70 factor (ECF subfamily)
LNGVLYAAEAQGPETKGMGVADARSDWLRRFHEGDRAIIEGIYREHFATVSRAVGAMTGPADRETLIHEIFLRLLSQPPLRCSFRGGDLAAWLTVVSRNHAIDGARHRRLEVPASAAAAKDHAGPDSGESGIEARLLIERFRRETLPPRWAPVFEARFLRQLSQEEAAATLGLGRTTLAYREARVRRLFRRFVQKERK